LRFFAMWLMARGTAKPAGGRPAGCSDVINGLGSPMRR
jgi:hypothetical protein